jgi:glycosyltransferase involved in cell wall biosynthesis
LGGAVDITGSVSDAVLGAHYATADVYVCLSEHEGFCVPLLEAMHHGIPVVAYRAGAITETMGDGGLGLESKDALTVSTAVARVMSDDSVRTALVQAGHERLGFFDLARSEATLREAIASVVGAS